MANAPFLTALNGTLTSSTALSSEMPVNLRTAADTYSTSEVDSLLAGYIEIADAPSGAIVGTTDTQTLTNKTLTAPAIVGGTITAADASAGMTRLLAVDGSGGLIDGNLYPFEHIGNFGAVSAASAAANTTAMQAATAVRRTLYVPAGTWQTTTNIANQKNSTITWFIDPNASFPDAPVDGNGHGIPDLTDVLGGRVFWMNRAGTHGIGFRIGGTGIWAEELRPHSLAISEVVVTSPNGGAALTGVARSSDGVSTGAAIGLQAIVNQDNTSIPYGCWGIYVDATRQDGSNNVLGCEIDVTNWEASIDPFHPFLDLSSTTTLSVALWLASGAENATSYNTTAAIGIIPNGTKFTRGIVFGQNSLDTSLYEAITLPHDYRINWYPSSSGTRAGIDGNGALFTKLSNTASDVASITLRKMKANGTSDTGSGDYLGVIQFNGYESGATKTFGYVRGQQRSAYSSNQARMSLDFGAVNADGTAREITFNGLGDNIFAPTNSNVIANGTSTNYWLHVTGGHMRIVDGITAPSTVSGLAQIYVDTADGDLKVKFGDGTVKTIVVDT